MINENIKLLRKKNNMTQQELADRLGISRQSVVKWENGETVPDIFNCNELATIFDVTIDNLIRFSYKEETLVGESALQGRYAFGVVKVGERGQIVIPKAAREVFNINPGDRVIILGDKTKGGLAIAKVFGEFTTKE